MAANPPIPAAATLSAATNGDETELFVSLDDQAWVAVAEVDDIPDLPSGEQSLYETTHMRSGDYQEWKKNKRRDGVEIDISGNYVIAGPAWERLKAMENAPGSIAFMLVLKQGAETWRETGRALFYSLRRSNPTGEKRRYTITAKPVAATTLTKDAA